jgi:hypothetical protein
LSGRGKRAAIVGVIRGVLVTAGLLAALWSALNFPPFLRRASNDHLATRILAGEVFKDDTIVRLLRTVDASRDRPRCDVPALHTLAILQLKKIENAIAARDEENVSQVATHDAIVASLSCAPADPFLWLVLAWVGSQSNPRSGDAVTFLRLSYQLGPNEGWIAIKRNYIAFTMFDQLPADIADRALIEFSHLVSSGIYGEAANIFLGPGWAQRESLLKKLTEIERFHRESFMNELSSKGYDVGVLGSNSARERNLH